MGQSCEIRQTA